MKRPTLRNSTALALSFSLAAPTPLMAQETPTCTIDSELPCVVPELDILVETNAQRNELLSSGQLLGDASGAFVSGSADSEAEARQQAGEGSGDRGGQATGQATEQAAGQASETGTEEAQPAPDAAQAEADTQAASEPEADVDDQTDDAFVAGSADSEAEARPQADTGGDQTPTEAEIEADLATEQAETEQAEGEVEAEANADRSETAEESQSDGNGAYVAGSADDEQRAREAADPMLAESAEERAARAEAQAEAAAQAEEEAQAAAASDGGEVVESDEITITEEVARSSDEEFQTEVDSTAGATANANTAAGADDDDDAILRTLGTAAAVGLGAYAVGSLLNDNSRVVSNSGDRVVVEKDGQYRIIKDDDTLLRRPGSTVETQTYSDGSTRTVVTAQDGTETITVRAENGRVLRRVRILPDGTQVELFDDTREFARVDVDELSTTRAQEYDFTNARTDELRAALAADQAVDVSRTYSLNQVRYIDAVRHQVPVVALDAVNFETGSAVIRPAEAEELSALGQAMKDAIGRDPSQVFLIEGHTDTVGPASYNLSLSDRRAESVALALTEYFDVPPANMIIQGYGESDLKVRRAGDIRANRRAAVRNITPLLNER